MKMDSLSKEKNFRIKINPKSKNSSNYGLSKTYKSNLIYFIFDKLNSSLNGLRITHSTVCFNVVKLLSYLHIFHPLFHK